jgi:hypothetical protein
MEGYGEGGEWKEGMRCWEEKEEKEEKGGRGEERRRGEEGRGEEESVLILPMQENEDSDEDFVEMSPQLREEIAQMRKIYGMNCITERYKYTRVRAPRLYQP